MAGEEWSIGRLLTWTADYLKKQGAESPRLDAEVLLAHARGCQRLDLYTAFAELASDAVRATYRELVKQRAAGKPVALVVEQALPHRPAAVQRPDEVLLGHLHVREEGLAEGRGTGDQQDGPGLDPRGAHVDQDKGNALVLA